MSVYNHAILFTISNAKRNRNADSVITSLLVWNAGVLINKLGREIPNISTPAATLLLAPPTAPINMYP